MSRKETNPAAESLGAPSDLELMLYADGELDEARLPAVEAYLDRSAVARAKLRALDVGSLLVREQALGAASKADGLADAIFAKIQAEATTAPESPSPKEATVHPLPLPRVPLAKSKPANDGSRTLFTLAAVAFAAAAGLMIWGKVRIAPDPQAHLRPMPAHTAPAARPELPLPTPVKTADVAVEDDNDHGVEVATVNFGSRMGSIFYVPKGVAASNATTTVVWLNDDAAGGE
jgi:anti-sigma factor RsiW